MQWTEENSRDFLDTGRYFVPDRDEQIGTICELIPPAGRTGLVLDLCCGEGLLSQALLQRYPECRVLGLDGSTTMLASARERCQVFGSRFDARRFDLAEQGWRIQESRAGAVVSSLAIHHLDGPGKRELFADIYNLLLPGGGLIIADLIQPASPVAAAMAALAWDASVRRKALELDGNTRIFDHFQQTGWNLFLYPDDMDKPSRLTDQLQWFVESGYIGSDVFWMKAGHAIYGAFKSDFIIPEIQ